MDPAAVAEHNRAAGPSQAVMQIADMVAKIAQATGDPRLEQAAQLLHEAASGSGSGHPGDGAIRTAQAGPGNLAAPEGQLQGNSGTPPGVIHRGNRPISRPAGAWHAVGGL